eukprot:s1_g2423.t1
MPNGRGVGAVKGSIQALLTLLCAMVLLPAQAAATDFYVYELTTSLHQEPGPEEPVVHTINYGDRVIVAATPDTSTPDGWIAGKADGGTICIMGYVRSAGLLPVPAPDLTQSGFVSLTGRLQKITDPTTDKTDDVTTTEQTFDHGVTLVTRTFHTAYGDFEEQHLGVSGISVAQGFLLARAMVNQEGATSDHMARVPNVEKDTEGRPFILDESHWQIISVKETPDGVVIAFPERAD